MRSSLKDDDNQDGSSGIRNTRRSAGYSAPDPLRRIFRCINDPTLAAISRRTNFGYPATTYRRNNIINSARLLSAVSLPGPSSIHIGTDTTDWSKVTSAITSSLQSGNGGLLDLGDAVAGAQQTFVTRQVTLTDFCQPDAEWPGSLILTIRHPMDITAMAVQSTPAGRDCRGMDIAWFDLSEVAAVSINRMDAGGVRASLVSLAFLAASRYNDYIDRNAADTLRTHIISNSNCRNITDKLDRFGACLAMMVRCRAFPHRFMNPLGGLLSWVSQREIASVTAVVSGIQEGVKTEQSNVPRSSFSVPACVYVDLDKEIKMPNIDNSTSTIYLLFVYTQRLGREGVRAHIIQSHLAETSLKEGLEHMYARLRASNVINGNANGSIKRSSPNAEFPLLKLYREFKTDRAQAVGWSKRNAAPKNLNIDNNNDATNDQEAQPRYVPFPIAGGTYNWQPDLRNLPSPDSCMYAAYCRLGYTDEVSKTVRSYERCGSVNLPIITIKGVAWNIGGWKECY